MPKKIAMKKENGGLERMVTGEEDEEYELIDMPNELKKKEEYGGRNEKEGDHDSRLTITIDYSQNHDSLQDQEHNK